MTSHTLPGLVPASVRVEPQLQNNPFLKALEHIEYGRLTIITPEGDTLKYAGAEKGPDAYLRLYGWDALDTLMTYGDIGFGEAYIQQRWDSDDLSTLLTFGLINAHILERFFHGRPWYVLWTRLKHMLNANSLSGSRRNIMRHYDLGNEFYSLWLDRSMTYSCGLFEGDANRTLEEAQHAKYQRILGKLDASPGDHILEIGCGWGGFAESAAKHGLHVTAITISPEQAEYAKARLERAGLANKVRIKLQDYRHLTGSYDHIVSIGMLEHVGEAYWPSYFSTIKRCLRPRGHAMIQSITIDDYLFESLHHYSGFIEQYIFPGGMLPSKSRLYANAAAQGLTCREIFGFGHDYARTLREWTKRFNHHESAIRKLGYNEDFMRMWRFYLASCIASFSVRRTDVVQAQFTHS